MPRAPVQPGQSHTFSGQAWTIATCVCHCGVLRNTEVGGWAPDKTLKGALEGCCLVSFCKPKAGLWESLRTEREWEEEGFPISLSGQSQAPPQARKSQASHLLFPLVFPHYLLLCLLKEGFCAVLSSRLGWCWLLSSCGRERALKAGRGSL